MPWARYIWCPGCLRHFQVPRWDSWRALECAWCDVQMAACVYTDCSLGDFSQHVADAFRALRDKSPS